METKTNWRNLENYDYLGAYSLNGIKEEITLTVKDVKQKEVIGEGGVKSEKIVVYFEENNVDGVVVKPMIFNKTNCKTISKLYDTEFIEDWRGKRITIYSTTTRFGRETKPCLRIKEEVPKEEVYTCSVCGKAIDKKTYQGTVQKYGVALCSAECKEDYLVEKTKKEETENK